jgi:hypothetical protein
MRKKQALFELLVLVLIVGTSLGGAVALDKSGGLIEVEDYEVEVVSTTPATVEIFQEPEAPAPVEPELEERPVEEWRILKEVEPVAEKYEAESGQTPPTETEVEYLEIVWKTRNLRILVPSSDVQIEEEYVILPDDVAIPLNEVELIEHIATVTSSTG